MHCMTPDPSCTQYPDDLFHCYDLEMHPLILEPNVEKLQLREANLYLIALCFPATC